LHARSVARVIVSTDDEQIAEIARAYGAEVPFMRPDVIAKDDTPDLPVFQHALDWLSKTEQYQPEIIVQLRPTSPLRRVWHIDQAVSKLIEHPEASAVRTVCVPFQNPYKMWNIGQDGFLKPLLNTKFDEPYNLPRQALPDVYWQTGYVDAFWANTVLMGNSITGNQILPLVIKSSEWVDIDSLDDWRRAERLLVSGEITFEDLGFEVRKVN